MRRPAPWIVVVRRRAGADDGSAVVEFVALAVLLLVPLIYLVMMLARLQAGSFAVTQAAREAGRAYVTAQQAGEAPGRARAAADIAFEDQGFGGQGELSISCSATPCFTPEASISSTATVTVPLPLVPAFARDVIPLEVPVSATQVSTVPRYEVRS
ncbi:hypothetical protein GCM10022199_14860 [Marihabitans asiaticum]|uniref:TadE-like protein n=1 Tax=Marihabitans asiaticum TaxID=415218 RepID=A0A560W877_9MICO|nr:pilus assembly protein [Marihabitans asiaticum]TWD13821.1 hypothetical protein FB557_2461 [Marihabitans asiaticum]